jgi:hypothetical protein
MGGGELLKAAQENSLAGPNGQRLLHHINTGCASYFWTTFKQPGRGINIVIEFFALQTKYSLVSADAKMSTKGSVAPTI